MRYCENKGTCVYLETSGWGCWKIWTERKRGYDGMWVVSIFIFWAIKGSIAIVMSYLECCQCGSQTRAGPRIVSPGLRKQSSGSHVTSNSVFVFPVNIFMTPRPRILECVNQNLPTDTRLIIDSFLWGSHVYFLSSRPLMCYIFVSAFDG